jgi:hypothetical protein
MIRERSARKCARLSQRIPPRQLEIRLIGQRCGFDACARVLAHEVPVSDLAQFGTGIASKDDRQVKNVGTGVLHLVLSK